jgi:hypothetical protein
LPLSTSITKEECKKTTFFLSISISPESGLTAIRHCERSEAICIFQIIAAKMTIQHHQTILFISQIVSSLRTSQ